MAPTRRKSTIQGNFRSHTHEDSLHKNQPKNQAIQPSLKESLVGIYDNPERDPREHVISIAFLCKITEGKTKLGAKVEAVNSFSEAETKNLEIAFDHRKTVEDGFSILTKKDSTTKDEPLNATQIQRNLRC